MTTCAKTISLTASIDLLYKDLFAADHGLNITEHVYLADRPDSSALAETLVETVDDNLFISIRISPQLARDISGKSSPFDALNSSNLAGLAVLAEEVSHFHLVCLAATRNAPVSRHDLELQSEFDKFLLAATLMQRQSGSPHLRHLARLLFDSTHAYQTDPIYDVTENLAAQWWWQHINAYGNSMFGMPYFVRALRELRTLQGQAKLDFLRMTLTPSPRVVA